MAGRWLAGCLLTWVAVAHLTAADLELATLKSGTDVFTNVTVYGQTATDLFIKHARGFGNVKIASLDNATLRLLKLGGATPEEETTSATSEKVAATMATMRAKLESSSPWKIPSEAEVLAVISRMRPTPNLIALVILIYLIGCIGMKRICLNAGSKPGPMIWIPGLQMFPLLRAAKMTGWWFVVFLIPLVGVVAHVVWCVKIAKACGKGPGLTLLLILPGINLLALIYLALANGNSQPADDATPMRGQRVVLGEA